MIRFCASLVILLINEEDGLGCRGVGAEWGLRAGVGCAVVTVEKPDDGRLLDARCKARWRFTGAGGAFLCFRRTGGGGAGCILSELVRADRPTGLTG